MCKIVILYNKYFSPLHTGEALVELHWKLLHLKTVSNSWNCWMNIWIMFFRWMKRTPKKNSFHRGGIYHKNGNKIEGPLHIISWEKSIYMFPTKNISLLLTQGRPWWSFTTPTSTTAPPGTASTRGGAGAPTQRLEGASLMLRIWPGGGPLGRGEVSNKLCFFFFLEWNIFF